MIVLDASAAVEFALRPHAYEDIGRHLKGASVRVPAHFDVEAFGTIMRLLRLGTISELEAILGLSQIVRLPAERVAVAEMLAEAYALRTRFSSNDTFYAIIARRSSALLVTCDARLARAAEGFADVSFIKLR